MRQRECVVKKRCNGSFLFLFREMEREIQTLYALRSRHYMMTEETTGYPVGEVFPDHPIQNYSSPLTYRQPHSSFPFYLFSWHLPPFNIHKFKHTLNHILLIYILLSIFLNHKVRFMRARTLICFVHSTTAGIY